MDAEDVEALQREERHLVELAQRVQRRKEELLAAEQEFASAEETYEWHRLQAAVAADTEAKELARAIDEAIQAFEASLTPPESAGSGEEPYEDTDDCGDLSSVESTLDDVLEVISEVRRNASNLERAVAMLLLVSIKFQRLVDISEDRSGTSGRPKAQALDGSEFDELKSSLLSEWADTLDDLTAGGEDVNLVLRMLTNKLGPPFDELADRGSR